MSARGQDVTLMASIGTGPTQPGDEALATQDGPELVPGVLVGRYIVIARLGEGGMGVIHRAYDPELDRKVALKLRGVTLSGGSQRPRGGQRADQEWPARWPGDGQPQGRSGAIPPTS